MSKNEQQNSNNTNTQKNNRDDTHKENAEATQQTRQLKDRFLEAVIKGELGSVENSGTVVTLKEFKAYFSDIKTDYINSFLPAATLEPGQSSASRTKYLFRVRKGAYLVHADALAVYVQQQGLTSSGERKRNGERDGE